MEAVDERTVRITIDAPKEYFLSKLAYPSSAVVDRLTVEPLGDDWWMSDDVNGSGPYGLLRWDEEVVILQRFDDYHTPVSLEYLISPPRRPTRGRRVGHVRDGRLGWGVRRQPCAR